LARRKSAAAQLYGAYKKRKQAKEQAERRAQRELDRWEQRQRREAEQEEAQQRRQAEQAEREASRREQEKERARKQQADEARRAEGQQRLEEAERKRAEIEARVAELGGILTARPRELSTHQVALEQAFQAEGSAALAALVEKALAGSPYPAGFPRIGKVMFAPESRELLINYDLPGQDVVPAVADYKIVRGRDEIQPVPRKDAEIKKLYADVIARTTLRTLDEAFQVTPSALVDGIVLNAYVASVDRATGQPCHPLLISVSATREMFIGFNLDAPELDPVLCLRTLNAIVSPHPYDLEPVRPVVQFDLSKYKFVEEMDVVAGLDSRPDLLALKPVEFEHLIRRLFEAIGMKAWVTQASRDDGVDAVATNEDPVVGGLCVIQAKRYSQVVGLESVHALAGVMADKAATKGILVTTSWFGKASHDFAARTGRMDLITGRELKALLLEHLGLDALIGLPKLPPGWERRDIS
jgi:restriction system protein